MEIAGAVTRRRRSNRRGCAHHRHLFYVEFFCAEKTSRLSPTSEFMIARGPTVAHPGERTAERQVSPDRNGSAIHILAQTSV